MRIWKTIVALAAVACAAGVAIGGVTESRLHPWSRWQPGSWVETEIDPIGSGKMLSRETLVEAGRDAVRLHVKTNMSGPDGPVEIDAERIVGYAFMGGAHLDAGREKVGTETLVYLGKRYECTVWSATGRIDKDRSEERAWTTEGILYPLRVETKLEGYELVLNLVRMDDVFRVGSERVACVRYEGTAMTNGEEMTVYQLRSAEVPGGWVRTEMRIPREDGTIGVHSNTVVAFDALESTD